MSAKSPIVALSEVIAERDKLKAEVMRLKQCAKQWSATLDECLMAGIETVDLATMVRITLEMEEAAKDAA